MGCALRKVSFVGAAAMLALMASPVVAQDTTSQAPSDDKATTTVVVTGKTQETVHKIDRTVYDLKDNAQATTGSVSDVLVTLPSVNVDTNGSVTVRGGSVQVLVDGKPSAALKGANLATALQSMPANTIAKIEVITNPGAEFHTDAATVINIITRKTRGKAPAGTLVVNGGTSARYNTTVSGSAGVGKWSFSGSASLRQDQRNNFITVDRITTADDGTMTSHFAEDARVKVHINMAVLNASATYAATDNDSLSLIADLTLRNRPRRDADRITFYNPAGPKISESTTYANGRQYFNNGALTAIWKHKGKRDGETLTVQSRHEEDENMRNFRYDEVFALPRSLDSFYRRARTERELNDDLSADYVLPLGQDRQFKSGFDISYGRDENATLSSNTDSTTRVETIDIAHSNRFLIDQTLSAAYLDYQQPLNQWVAEAGLRTETLRTRLRQARTGGVIETHDVQWSPSLYLSRELNTKSKLKFSYSHRIERPESDQLNPLDYVLDGQDIQAGNPYLRPGQTESFEVGYDYTTQPVNFSGTVYARQLRDTIIQYNFYRNPGDTLLITSYENAGHGTSAGLDMSLTLKRSAKIAWNLNSNLYTTSQTAPVGGVDYSQSIFSHQTKASFTYMPKAGDNLQIQAILNGKQLMAQGTISGANLLNLSYSKKLSPRVTLVATASDVLNTVRLHELIRTKAFRDRTQIAIPGSVFYIGLSYKLGAIKA